MPFYFSRRVTWQLILLIQVPVPMGFLLIVLPDLAQDMLAEPPPSTPRARLWWETTERVEIR